MKLATTISGLICVAALLSASAQAAVVKVPADYSTIQAAVTAASPGDVVLVKQGTYEPFWFTTKTNVTVRGQGKVVIDASSGTTGGTGIQIQTSTSCLIENLTIKNASEMGIWIQSSYAIEIRQCRIEDVLQHGIVGSGNSRTHLVKNTIRRVGGHGITLVGNYGAVIRNSVSRTTGFGINVQGSAYSIHKNTIRDTQDEGIRVGYRTTASNNVSLTDNTIERALDVGIHLLGSGSSNQISGNRVNRPNGIGIMIEASGGGHVVDDNHVARSTGAGLRIDALLCLVTRNSVKRSSEDGLFVYNDADWCTITGNQVSKSALNGIIVFGTYNAFSSNSSKRSGDLDLRSVSSPTLNTYVDNSFGTTNL